MRANAILTDFLFLPLFLFTCECSFLSYWAKNEERFLVRKKKAKEVNVRLVKIENYFCHQKVPSIPYICLFIVHWSCKFLMKDSFFLFYFLFVSSDLFRSKLEGDSFSIMNISTGFLKSLVTHEFVFISKSNVST